MSKWKENVDYFLMHLADSGRKEEQRERADTESVSLSFLFYSISFFRMRSSP